MCGEISLHLYGDFEEAIKRGVLLHLQPDGIGKIDLAEDRVGAGWGGLRIPADDGHFAYSWISQISAGLFSPVAQLSRL